jgi:hypothetical protein
MKGLFRPIGRLVNLRGVYVMVATLSHDGGAIWISGQI